MGLGEKHAFFASSNVCATDVLHSRSWPLRQCCDNPAFRSRAGLTCCDAVRVVKLSALHSNCTVTGSLAFTDTIDDMLYCGEWGVD